MKKELAPHVSFEQLSLIGLILFFVTDRIGFAYAALIFLLLALFDWRPLDGIASAWQQMLRFIGSVNQRIILTTVYFLFITPYGFLFRLFHRSQERRFMGSDTSPTSYVAPDAHVASRQSFDRLW